MTMLESTAVGSVSMPISHSAAARRFALSWSVLSRHGPSARAQSPAAAMHPACLIPPPSTLRARRALRTNSALPSSTEPMERAEALGQAHGGRVGVLDHRGGGLPQRHRRVDDPRAIEVEHEAVRARRLRRPPHVVPGEHPPAALVVRVLEAQQTRRGEVVVGLADRVLHGGKVDRPVGEVGERPGMDRGDLGAPSLLVDMDVALVAEDHLAPTGVAVDHNGDEVGHRPGRHEDRGILLEERRCLPF
eukprot:CAMPEP_0177618784 /NCGR_PEP_ID=MMETSP0419_2-20121207/25816_1 /TAXON_ID=582737 /ORGANISM="Tetraselmis sp., Strain GSL018" /LENGTH=246 /DNA_ID=CAMNT_0019117817 /DNA_START=302 /DNA_END=1042 /DNA_ORIENTATION=+